MPPSQEMNASFKGGMLRKLLEFSAPFAFTCNHEPCARDFGKDRAGGVKEDLMRLDRHQSADNPDHWGLGLGQVRDSKFGPEGSPSITIVLERREIEPKGNAGDTRWRADAVPKQIRTLSFAKGNDAGGGATERPFDFKEEARPCW